MVLPVVVVIPHIFLLLYPFEVDCQPREEEAHLSARGLRQEAAVECPGQDVASHLRGDNVDILCAGHLVRCLCQVTGCIFFCQEGRREGTTVRGYTHEHTPRQN